MTEGMGIFYVARCPVHGIHGQRAECFDCGGVVEQIPVITVDEHERIVERVRREPRKRHTLTDADWNAS